MPKKRCPHCNAPINPWLEECSHRRACEGRQMLDLGLPVEQAANHAQRLAPRTEGLDALHRARDQGQIVSDMEMDRQAARDGYNPNR